MTVQEVGAGEEVRMLATGLARLREEFPAETVGKLPKITCPACSKKECRDQAHNKKRCNECGGYMTPAHIHIEFVGHAPVTDRLLEVDPCWSWEPFAVGADGLPALVKNERGSPVGMWIRLTVLGVTRPGYGSCEPKPDAVKELIGDALRNAAMRFGVALALWSKTDLELHIAEVKTTDYDADDQPKPTPAKRTGTEALARARAAVNRPAPTPPPLPAQKPPEAPAAQSEGVAPPPEGRGDSDSSNDAASRAGGADQPPGSPDTMTAAQNRMLHAALNGAGIKTDDERHKFATDTLGREVTTYTGLSKGDASALIDALKVGRAS